MDLYYRRLFLIISSPLLIVICSGGILFWYRSNCPTSTGNCQLLWGVALISILSGTLLVEILIAQKKNSTQLEKQNTQKDDPILSTSYIWFRPIAWVVLGSILAALPLIIQGAFVVTVIGSVIGILLMLFIRALSNRLPM